MLSHSLEVIPVPGHRSRVVDAECPSGGRIRASCVETSDGALRITDEFMISAPGQVLPGYRSRVVDAGYRGVERAWYVKARNALSMSRYFGCEENNKSS